MLDSYEQQRLAATAPDEIGLALERGNIVEFPTSPVQLPNAAALETLRTQLPQQLKRKNVSYHPEADRVTGLDKDSPIADLAYEVLTQHRDRVTTFLNTVMPALAQNIRVGTCSFRPLQEQGRNLKPHSSNELLHIDAGAYRATNGDRILRFFVNVNPDEDRVWASNGAFPELFAGLGQDAGLHQDLSGSLNRGPLGNLRTASLAAIGKLGLPLAVMLDSSPYDRVMRKFHNYMKDTPSFHQWGDRQVFRFKPFSAWMVFTDMVSHASLSGQHAFVYTARVPLENCQPPELAPINILRSAA